MSIKIEYGGRMRATPAFRKGDTFGKLKVLRYLIHSCDNPATGKHLAKPQHWYQVECSCGAQETVNQGQLRNDKRQCTACAVDQKSRTMMTHQDKDIAPTLPAEVRAALRARWR